MIWILFFSWMLVCSVGGMIVKYRRKQAIKKIKKEVTVYYMTQLVITQEDKVLIIPMN